MVKVDTYRQVNRAILKWLRRIRAENDTASGLLLKRKVLYFAKKVSFKNLPASGEWIDKWKKQWVIFFLYFIFWNDFVLQQVGNHFFKDTSVLFFTVNNNQVGSFVPSSSFCSTAFRCIITLQLFPLSPVYS